MPDPSSTELPQVKTRQTPKGWRWEIYEPGKPLAAQKATTDYPTQRLALDAGDRILMLMSLPADETDD